MRKKREDEWPNTRPLERREKVEWLLTDEEKLQIRRDVTDPYIGKDGYANPLEGLVDDIVATMEAIQDATAVAQTRKLVKWLDDRMEEYQYTEPDVNYYEEVMMQTPRNTWQEMLEEVGL